MKTPPLQQQGLEANQPTNEVVQKMYDLPTEQTTELIKKFKGQFTNTKTHKSASNQCTLALDSSVWLLEAALNYDFDSPRSIEVGYKDSLKFTTSISNNTISGTDFNIVYNTLANFLSQKLNSTTKIHVIDVSAIINEDNIVYSCDITLFHTTNGQKIATPCDPFTTEIASPSLYATSLPSYANYFLSCSGNPTLDGPTQVEIKLNSCSLPNCGNGYYYTNVSTQQVNGQQFPGRLYYRYGMTLSDFCLTANKSISATDLNTYKNGCQYLANLLKPTSPSGLSIINNYDIKLEIYSTLCSGCPNPYFAYWTLTVSYGVLHCNNGGAS